MCLEAMQSQAMELISQLTGENAIPVPEGLANKGVMGLLANPMAAAQMAEGVQVQVKNAAMLLENINNRLLLLEDAVNGKTA